MKTPRESNYRSFRIALHIDFDNIDINTKEQLAMLMQQKGYRTTGKNLSELSRPTQKQIEFAWNELQRNYEYQQPKKETNYVWIKSYSYKRGKKTVNVKGYQRKKWWLK